MDQKNNDILQNGSYKFNANILLAENDIDNNISVETDYEIEIGAKCIIVSLVGLWITGFLHPLSRLFGS